RGRPLVWGCHGSSLPLPSVAGVSWSGLPEYPAPSPESAGRGRDPASPQSSLTHTYIHTYSTNIYSTHSLIHTCAYPHVCTHIHTCTLTQTYTRTNTLR